MNTHSRTHIETITLSTHVHPRTRERYSKTLICLNETTLDTRPQPLGRQTPSPPTSLKLLKNFNSYQYVHVRAQVLFLPPSVLRQLTICARGSGGKPQ
jgi:hypothetical protein